MRIRDPRTQAEWQEAVDSARFFLLLDAARQFGLVTGGPGVDVHRCVEILRRGASVQILPAPDAELVDRLVRDMTHGDADGESGS